VAAKATNSATKTSTTKDTKITKKKLKNLVTFVVEKHRALRR